MAAIGLICKKKEGKKCSAFIIQYGHGGWANGLLLRAWICTSTTTSTTRQLKTQKADAAITAPNVYISLSIYCCSRFSFFFIRCHIYKLNMTDVKSNHHFSIRAHFSIMIILSISTVHIFAFFCHCLNKLACTAQYESSRLFFANFYKFIFMFLIVKLILCRLEIL